VESVEPRTNSKLERLGAGIGWRMIHLNLKGQTTGALAVLCLGAHSDDIEIGCGGTILRLAEQCTGTLFHWVVFSAIGVREAEAREAAKLFVDPTALRGPLLKMFPDGFMPFVGADVKAVFEELKQAVSPDVIFTPHRMDAHQDHRLIADLTWNTFRDHFILEYEIPKYDGDLGQPSVFVPLEAEMCQKKVGYIMKAFQSQHTKRWFEKDTFLSLLRLRGMECNAPSGYAEAFYCRKMVL
jgi:LmbE family N-acetylglucosaminyl deacetylase